MADSGPTEVYCCLMAEARADFAAMSASRLSLLSRQGSKLGLGPVDRTRLAPQPPEPRPIPSTNSTTRARNSSLRPHEMKRRQPLEIDIAREAREIRRLAPRNHLAACSPDFIRETAFLLAKAHANHWQIGFRETMKLLHNLNLLGMTPLAGRRAGPTRGGGGGDDAA